ncbi:MAG: glycosyltransferase family 4 protein, partial [Planctomycetota bacterium]
MPAPSDSPSVLFVGKYGFDDSAGNAVAIRRVTACMEAQGTRLRYVQAAELTEGSAGEAAMALFGFTPTVVHALHAGHAAEYGAALASAFSVPLVITVTGTDLNAADESAIVMGERLRRASAIVALTGGQLDQLGAVAPDVRAVRIPQAVVFGEEPLDLREAIRTIAGPAALRPRLALLAGGLRSVKGQLFALEAFARESERLDDWLLVIAGPVLEPDYARAVRERAHELAGAAYIGEIEHGAMLAALRGSDALINASENEGEPQIILEAQCAGLPVLARRVVGNVELVEDDVNGLLVPADDSETMASALARLVNEADLRQRLAASAYNRVIENFSLERMLA